MVNEVIDKIRDAEIRSEKLIKDAEINADRDLASFYEERERRLQGVRDENERIEKRLVAEAQKEAGKEESAILSDAQREMNTLRAAADKKKEEAVLFIVRRIVES